MANISEAVINFAIYEDSTEYLGMAEVTLPELSNMTEDVKGAGIAGSYSSVIQGHIESMSLTLNFRTMTRDVVKLYEQRNHTLDLRLAQQGKDTTAGVVTTTPVKHIMIVQPKKLSPGKVAPASPADASAEFAVTYWATYIDGEKVLEIDMLNFIYNVNGTDYLADVRKALGK